MGMILRNKILLTASLQKPILRNLFGTIGNFEQDSDSDGLADGWTRSSGLIPCSLENNIQSFTPSAQYHNVKSDFSIPTNHVGYWCLYIQTLAPSIYIQTPVSDGTGNNINPGTSEDFMFVSRRSDSFSGTTIQIATSSTTSFGVVRLKMVCGFDLTATFGAGKEPTKEAMDAFMQAQTEYFVTKEYVPVAV
jgi:hypothetical protein